MVLLSFRQLLTLRQYTKITGAIVDSVKSCPWISIT